MGSAGNASGPRRRDDVTLTLLQNRAVKSGSASGTTAIVSDGNLLRPSRAAAVEQWARQSSAGNRIVVGSSNVPERRGSNNSAGSFYMKTALLNTKINL